MMQKQSTTTTLPGVFSTLSAGFELTTRYLWLALIPAALDFFLWLGPRLSFQPLIESIAAQMPAQTMPVDPLPLLEAAAGRLNHFTYLSVSGMGVPALMTGLTPEKTPIQPEIIVRDGLGAWFGYLVLFTLAGLLLTAIYYSLIAYALRRTAASAMGQAAPFTPIGFARRTGRTWLRLVGLAALFLFLVMLIVFPVTILAGFLSLLSQAIGTVFILGGLMLVIWVMMFLSYTPQGMALNPRSLPQALVESVRLFRANLPTSLSLLFVVVLIRRLLEALLLSADSGTWVTGINLLAHAYISTALIAAMFIFYRDRYAAFLRNAQPTNNLDQVKQ